MIWGFDIALDHWTNALSKYEKVNGLDYGLGLGLVHRSVLSVLNVLLTVGFSQQFCTVATG